MVNKGDGPKFGTFSYKLHDLHWYVLYCVWSNWKCRSNYYEIMFRIIGSGDRGARCKCGYSTWHNGYSVWCGHNNFLMTVTQHNVTYGLVRITPFGTQLSGRSRCVWILAR